MINVLLLSSADLVYPVDRMTDAFEEFSNAFADCTDSFYSINSLLGFDVNYKNTSTNALREELRRWLAKLFPLNGTIVPDNGMAVYPRPRNKPNTAKFIRMMKGHAAHFT